MCGGFCEYAVSVRWGLLSRASGNEWECGQLTALKAFKSLITENAENTETTEHYGKAFLTF